MSTHPQNPLPPQLPIPGSGATIIHPAAEGRAFIILAFPAPTPSPTRSPSSFYFLTPTRPHLLNTTATLSTLSSVTQ